LTSVDLLIEPASKINQRRHREIVWCVARNTEVLCPNPPHQHGTSNVHVVIYPLMPRSKYPHFTREIAPVSVFYREICDVWPTARPSCSLPVVSSCSVSLSFTVLLYPYLFLLVFLRVSSLTCGQVDAVFFVLQYNSILPGSCK